MYLAGDYACLHLAVSLVYASGIRSPCVPRAARSERSRVGLVRDWQTEMQPVRPSALYRRGPVMAPQGRPQDASEPLLCCRATAGVGDSRRRSGLHARSGCSSEARKLLDDVLKAVVGSEWSPIRNKVSLWPRKNKEERASTLG